MTLNSSFFRKKNKLPVMLQTEAAECGLVCLGMIGRYYGHDIDVNGLRQKVAISISGTGIRSLVKIADGLGFGARVYRISIEELKRVQCPAIIHWNLNHFVVLKSANNDSVVIHDPSSGVRKLKFEEVSNHFTGIILELSPSLGFEKIVARKKIRIQSLWTRSKGLWSAIIQVCFLSVALQVAAFVVPFNIQLVTDQAIGRDDGILLIALSVGFGAVVFLQALIAAIREWMLQIFGNIMTYQMVGNLVRHMLRLPIEFYEKRHVGDILSRIGSTSVIQDVLTKGLVSALIDGVMAFASLAIMFYYSPTMTFVVLVVAVFNATISAIFYPFVRKSSEELLVSASRERSYIMENIRAIITIKLMGKEIDREIRWRNLYTNAINSSLNVGKVQISLNFIQSAVTSISLIVVTYIGADNIINSKGFSVGMLLAFISFRQTFSDRANTFISQALQLRLLDLHLDRVADIAATDAEFISTDDFDLEVKGSVSLKGVSFRYGDVDPWVVRNFNLEVNAGEFVAITGPSGSGKSTILKLMLGLHIPTEGSVALDGMVATPELFRRWREGVGVVMQDDQLLSGSIADNIAFFDQNLDMDRIREAATLAQVHDDIMRKPMKYLSLVGDMGSSLSGGQKQRILLARALYRKPKVLILDEGTANLDLENEDKISKIIESMNITRIIVAHRPLLVERAHRVILLDTI